MEEEIEESISTQIVDEKSQGYENRRVDLTARSLIVSKKQEQKMYYSQLVIYE